MALNGGGGCVLGVRISIWMPEETWLLAQPSLIVVPGGPLSPAGGVYVVHWKTRRSWSQSSPNSLNDISSTGKWEQELDPAKWL